MQNTLHFCILIMTCITYKLLFHYLCFCLFAHARSPGIILTIGGEVIILVLFPNLDKILTIFQGIYIK